MQLTITSSKVEVDRLLEILRQIAEDPSDFDSAPRIDALDARDWVDKLEAASRAPATATRKPARAA